MSDGAGRQGEPERRGPVVADRLRRARRRRFVGPAAELELMTGALAAPEPPFAVAFVHGPRLDLRTSNRPRAASAERWPACWRCPSASCWPGAWEPGAACCCWTRSSPRARSTAGCARSSCSGADWEPLLPVVAGLGLRGVAWDAPGFGRAVASAGFAQSVEAHAAFVGRALDALGIDRAHLVLHDFGGPWGLAWAAGHPERFASAVLLNTGALPGYRWHALARLWRTPLLGELFAASTTRAGFGLLLRRGQPRPRPRTFVDRIYADFDRETRRAVLELYRSVPDVAAAGRALAGALRPLDRPALVLWGRDDPYLRVEQGERQREAFPRADVRVLDDARVSSASRRAPVGARGRPGHDRRRDGG